MSEVKMSNTVNSPANLGIKRRCTRVRRLSHHHQSPRSPGANALLRVIASIAHILLAIPPRASTYRSTCSPIPPIPSPGSSFRTSINVERFSLYPISDWSCSPVMEFQVEKFSKETNLTSGHVDNGMKAPLIRKTWADDGNGVSYMRT